jgi:hypothetical protein
MCSDLVVIVVLLVENVSLFVLIVLCSGLLVLRIVHQIKTKLFFLFSVFVLFSYIRHHYAKLTADLNVEVRFIDSSRGKGLFAKESVRMFRPVFSEVPLVSHRKLFDHAAPEVTTNRNTK